ncbi:hypothetical protein LU447_004310 [Salmonella enterica]|nr:hypothetical protein [Salmonella enterica]
MTTKVTKESLAENIGRLESYGDLSLNEEYQLKAYRLLYQVWTQEPDAYVTYKGYLLHAADPKVANHSQPEPLFYNEMLHND